MGGLEGGWCSPAVRQGVFLEWLRIRLFAFMAVLLCVGAFPSALSAPPQELITMEPICDPANARPPVLPPGNPAPGTRKMAQRLAEIYGKADLNSAAYFSDRLVTNFLQRVNQAVDLKEKLQL